MIACLRQAAASGRDNGRREDFSLSCGKALLNEGVGETTTLVPPRAGKAPRDPLLTKSIVLLGDLYKGGDRPVRGRLAQGLLKAEVKGEGASYESWDLSCLVWSVGP
jgi:hypothetical protein